MNKEELVELLSEKGAAFLAGVIEDRMTYLMTVAIKNKNPNEYMNVYEKGQEDVLNRLNKFMKELNAVIGDTELPNVEYVMKKGMEN